MEQNDRKPEREATTRPYYEAYDERYKTVHGLGLRWAGSRPTPIVLQMLQKYLPDRSAPVLELGCGEGRDARAVLEAGYDLLATDISPAAIACCRADLPQFAGRFALLDCVAGRHEGQYAFVYAVALLHMLVADRDRAAFFRFVKEHLRPGGKALICSMGDGSFEMQSDIRTAFELRPRRHPSGELLVAGTSCRMVGFAQLERELQAAGLRPVEQGLTEALPDFDRLMYVVAEDAE